MCKLRGEEGARLHCAQNGDKVWGASAFSAAVSLPALLLVSQLIPILANFACRFSTLRLNTICLVYGVLCCRFGC